MSPALADGYYIKLFYSFFKNIFYVNCYVFLNGFSLEMDSYPHTTREVLLQHFYYLLCEL